MSVLADEQLPALIVNSVRYGNGIGTLVSSQCDYLAIPAAAATATIAS